MRNRQLRFALSTSLAAACLLAAPPVWAVATLTGLVATPTGEGIPNATFTMEREEDEKDGKAPPPVVLTTDNTGRFTVNDLAPGSYTLRSTASGQRTTEAVTLRDGETVERWLSPSSDPENPGPGNFSLGLGGFFMQRSVDITKRTTTVDDGTKTTTTNGDTTALNRQNKYDVNTYTGFVQLGYGLPRIGFDALGGYVGMDTTVYGRVGAGTTSLDVKGDEGRFSVDSGASAFVGGGINAKLTHSRSPVYAVFGFSWYYMDLAGLGTNEGASAGARDVQVDGSQFGWDVSAVVGAKLGRLFPNQVPPQLGKVNVQAGLVGSWLSVDATSRRAQPGSCTTVPGKVLGPYPDSPREPDKTVCSGDAQTTVKRSFSEQSAIGGRLAVTAPLFKQSNALIQADFGGDWWSIVAKFAVTFGP
jgi:hypothetical protein